MFCNLPSTWIFYCSLSGYNRICICMWVYMYMHMYMCAYIYECMHMYTCNKCVIENMTYCYICNKIQCDAVTGRSVFSKHSHDRYTIVCPHGQDMGCLLPVKSLISYSVSITAVLHKIWDLWSTALWRHSAVFTSCTTLNGKSSCSRQEREICTDIIAEKMQWNILKELKIRECFSMAMSNDLQWFANKFRCIQSWAILHLQNSACLYNHRHLIVNILNIIIKRFLILTLWIWAFTSIFCRSRVLEVGYRRASIKILETLIHAYGTGLVVFGVFFSCFIGWDKIKNFGFTWHSKWIKEEIYRSTSQLYISFSMHKKLKVSLY